VDFRLSQRVSIQPEVLYSTVGAKVSLASTVDEFRNKLGYISVPLLAKIYLLPELLSIDLGPQFSFLLSEKGNVNLGNTSSYDLSISGGITLHLLGPIFIQGRYNFGLNEIRPNTNVSNRVLQLSAGLRF